MANSQQRIHRALRDYQNRPDLTLSEIVKRHGVSTATLVEWAKAAGLPSRKRGRRKRSTPTPRHQAILDMLTLHTYEDTARHFSVSKQEIGRVVKRWRAFMAPRRAPYKPGDILRCGGRTYTVYDADLSYGTVMDDQGVLHPRFSWKRPQLIEKIGETTPSQSWYSQPLQRQAVPAAP